ncbi:signal transduction histidine kinase [Novosphingobium hassiacum]|uniref:histidine kinase n=1 Tax=Novosphingobium hassiacum TaxID=173676 RepID=A0A7W5ZY39_9SPHN|nr:response regulator [Novosphingobium hassiacum]MBB3860669.1 signal transduction histidine kinase [Novosphingobium hassiacum]
MNNAGEPIHFLIVDDLEENLVALEALLRRDGLSFLRARSGEEALELLLRHEIALALLDVQMPGMDGFELAEFMRGSERTRHVPIIFLTAGSADGQRRFRGYEAGAVDFIQKPIEGDILSSKATVFFDLHRQRREIEQQSKALADAAGRLEMQVHERTAELEHALERLRAETAERERAEASLRQSQKMEAVGQLTGGIAHDFNNMLTGIIGSLDLMRRRIEAKRYEELDRFMDAATTSAQRAASLTHRLLAFSRRQSLDPQPLDINALIGSITPLVHNALSEQIALETTLAEDLPAVLADANQLENAILNLVLNARDAMPEGGRLVIETAHEDFGMPCATIPPGLSAGHYVTVAVSDTGTGIPQDVMDKVFDPFFTTKPVGLGTGLGLSMVYGFAKQSGGAVQLDSRPGLGTTVRLHLPITAATLAHKGVAVPEATPRGDGERVLVVEDDPAVRMLVREVLEELHYEVVEFADPSDAVPLLASGTRIDLMISDVGMPGMTGRELADVARAHRPSLPILFITGYAENATLRGDFLSENMSMITKPFSLGDLAIRVSELTSSTVGTPIS